MTSNSENFIVTFKLTGVQIQAVDTNSVLSLICAQGWTGMAPLTMNNC